MRKILVIINLVLFGGTAFSQTVVKMEISSQPADAFTVTPLVSDKLPTNIPVAYGAIGYSISGGEEPYVFSWYENNILLNEGKNITFTPLDGKYYNLVVTDENKCSVSVPINTTSTSNISEIDYGILVFPSVVKDYVSVSIKSRDAKVEVFDSKGRYMFTKNISGDSQIPLNLAAGVYYIYVQVEQGFVVKKIIVQ